MLPAEPLQNICVLPSSAAGSELTEGAHPSQQHLSFVPILLESQGKMGQKWETPRKSEGNRIRKKEGERVGKSSEVWDSAVGRRSSGDVRQARVCEHGAEGRRWLTFQFLV